MSINLVRYFGGCVYLVPTWVIQMCTLVCTSKAIAGHWETSAILCLIARKPEQQAGSFA